MSTTPAIRLSELPAAEARAVFDGFLAGQPDRLAAFVAEVERRGGPAQRLDSSLDSLEPLWAWFIPEHRPDERLAGPYRMPIAPATDEVMRAEDPPWWYDFHPTFGQEMGPYVTRLVTGLAEYFFACTLTARPTSRWKLEKRRSSPHFQHPVLDLDGRGELDYATPISMVLQVMRGTRDYEPVDLRRHLERWLGLDPEWEAELERLSRPIGPWAVEALGREDRFTHRVTFDDAVAHRQAKRVERLGRDLAGAAGVEETVHEDREVLLVRAPRLSTAEMEAMVTSLWSSPATESHDSRT